jgi:hypothetical protein
MNLHFVVLQCSRRNHVIPTTTSVIALFLSDLEKVESSLKQTKLEEYHEIVN